MSLNNFGRYCFLLLGLLSLSCQVDNELTSNAATNEIAGNVIDSLAIAENTKVYIQEWESGQREIVVYNDGIIISENQELIACATCGVQSGDPYTSIRKEGEGFGIFLENETYYFHTRNQKVFLIEADFLKLEYTEDGVLENHVVKNSSDFGELLLDDLTRDVIQQMLLVDLPEYQKLFNDSEEAKLPIEYSYSFISDLNDFLSSNDIPAFMDEAYLSDLKFLKLPVSRETKVILVSGLMESGQSEMFLLTINDAFEVVDSLKLYSFKETEEGGILTRFQINKDYTILVIEEEKGASNSRIISEKKWQISEKGDFQKID